MKSHRSRHFLALVLGLALAACASVERTAPDAVSGLTAQVADRLYFGRNIPGGGSVSDQAWAGFLAEVVTPRFPAGLTVWPAQGQWRGLSGVIERESSFVLELIHPDDAATERAIREIAAEYKRRFSQEAVLRVRDRVEAGL